jgi:hypothetical protein
MELYRYAISWKTHSKGEEVHDLTAEETGAKLVELLKHNENAEHDVRHDGADYIRIRYWRTIYT